jgi:hypothetical protein
MPAEVKKNVVTVVNCCFMSVLIYCFAIILLFHFLMGVIGGVHCQV